MCFLADWGITSTIVRNKVLSPVPVVFVVIYNCPFSNGKAQIESPKKPSVPHENKKLCDSIVVVEANEGCKMTNKELFEGKAKTDLANPFLKRKVLGTSSKCVSP